MFVRYDLPDEQRPSVEHMEKLNAIIVDLAEENHRLKKTIRSAVAHLEKCDEDALGRDPQYGHPYLLEMIDRFKKATRDE